VEHEKWLAQAEVFAVSALEGEQLSQFEVHLAEGCALCEEKIRETAEVLVHLSKSLDKLSPPSAVKTHIFAEIEKDKPGYLFVHAQEGEWREIAPGIAAKVLAMDDTCKRVTALMRMQKGARYTDHRHALTEEMFVIEGSCYIAGRLLKAGDYHRAEAGSIHLDSHTDEGALMLVISSTQNELLA
jgi:quercetin dioxygenase-like cupin family protein